MSRSIRSRRRQRASAMVVWAPLLFSQWEGRRLSCSFDKWTSRLRAARVWSHLLMLLDSALSPSMYLRYASEWRSRWVFGGGATNMGVEGCCMTGAAGCGPGYGGGACCPGGPRTPTCCPYGLAPGAGGPAIGATPWLITPSYSAFLAVSRFLHSVPTSRLSSPKE